MRALAAVLGLAVVAAAPGTVVATQSASGRSAVALASAVVKQPTGLWVRLAGNVRGGNAVVSCDRGLTTASSSYFYEKAGVFRLPIAPPHADDCSVFGGVAGSGRVTVEIRANR
jgi:hypothetical protein